MSRFKDRHLKQKLNHKKEFEIKLTITDKQLKALEWLMLNSPFVSGDSVESTILGWIETVTIAHNKCGKETITEFKLR